jgi:hypothetical protein
MSDEQRKAKRAKITTGATKKMQGSPFTATVATSVAASTVPIATTSTTEVPPVALAASTTSEHVTTAANAHTLYGACKFWGSTSGSFLKLRSESNVFDLSFVKNFYEKAVAANLLVTVPTCLF